MAYDLVSSVVVGSGGASTISFNNIPQTGKDIILQCSLRVSDGNEAGFVRFNNSSATTYAHRFISANNSTPAVQVYNTTHFFLYWNDSSRTAGIFGSAEFSLLNYSSSTRFKSMSYNAITENNGTGKYQALGGGVFSSTTPVTSVQLIPQSSATFIENSTVSLYIIY
jgi:hypothetical protein